MKKKMLLQLMMMKMILLMLIMIMMMMMTMMIMMMMTVTNLTEDNKTQHHVAKSKHSDHGLQQTWFTGPSLVLCLFQLFQPFPDHMRQINHLIHGLMSGFLQNLRGK